jgi:hypothetical protein
MQFLKYSLLYKIFHFSKHKNLHEFKYICTTITLKHIIQALKFVSEVIL